METLLRQYHELVREVEAAMAPLLERHQATLRCAPGCAECCRSLSLLAVEARVVSEALRILPRAEQTVIRCQAKWTSGACPFLLHGLCAIYQARPLICRTHGLAIGYVDEERKAIEVSACPRNFAEDFPLTAADLLMLDPFNNRLASINLGFAEAIGLEPATRVEMGELILTKPLL